MALTQDQVKAPCMMPSIVRAAGDVRGHLAGDCRSSRGAQRGQDQSASPRHESMMLHFGATESSWLHLF
eukprot:CAMPEP_0115108408 /NCGR_PEP_ID=MMETSP0227-20121206/37987_1 /TAXON_ID=89957 /ORGANISM="Polarella glacialis, Strain CCMP 1383" /LENGTH=68 /DNA_ID=CAMNT_0002506699 /DNA_START=9 /DNA_END=215 /DNA_ORIENTATION=-